MVSGPTVLNGHNGHSRTMSDINQESRFSYCFSEIYTRLQNIYALVFCNFSTFTYPALDIPKPCETKTYTFKIKKQTSSAPVRVERKPAAVSESGSNETILSLAGCVVVRKPNPSFTP